MGSNISVSQCNKTTQYQWQKKNTREKKSYSAYPNTIHNKTSEVWNTDQNYWYYFKTSILNTKEEKRKERLKNTP